MFQNDFLVTTKCWLQRKKISRFPSPKRCDISSSTEKLTERCSRSEKCFTTIWCTDESFTCSSFILCPKIVINQFSTIHTIIFFIRDSRTESYRKVCRRCLTDGLRVRSGIPGLSSMIFEHLQWPIINFENYQKYFLRMKLLDCRWHWCLWQFSDIVDKKVCWWPLSLFHLLFYPYLNFTLTLISA